MKELYDFENTLSSLSEEAQVHSTNDFGGTRNLEDKDLYSGLTYLEQGMAQIMGELAAHGKTESQSKTLMNAAIKDLVDTAAIEEPPTEEDSDGAKAMWISMAQPRIIAHLRLSGKIM